MKFALTALALIAAPAIAQDAAPVELWGGIKLGMNGRDARALYPKLKAQLTDKCSLYVQWETDRSKDSHVTAVSLQGTGGDHCEPVVRDALREKYGEPVNTSTIEATLRKPGTEYTYTFQGNGVQVALWMTQGAAMWDTYKVTYSPLSTIKSAAAKL